MKVLGITAEYNPFHNGHAYHIREAKARTGCDSVIVLMSGDFTERGTPACMDKYKRAEAALQNGADIVMELPVYSATSGAEMFADGAVRAFSALGTDVISYGVECPEDTASSLAETYAAIQKAAAFFCEESEEYRLLLKDGLSHGQTFAGARWNALLTLCPELSGLSSTPNNILAIEYEKAILRHLCDFHAVPVRRIGNGYHDTRPGVYASASAVRTAMKQGEVSEESVPENVRNLYRASLSFFLQEDDFSLPLFTAIRHPVSESLDSYSDVSPEIAARILSCASRPFSWTSLSESVKDRSHTRSYVDRALCHILLGITEEKQKQYLSTPFPPYLHVLGMKKTAAPLLGSLAERSRSPLLVRLARDWDKLSPEASMLYQTEYESAALYQNALFSKGCFCEEERTRKFLIVE